MTENKVLMQKSRESLAGKWETPLLTYLLYMVITSVGGPVGFVVGGPMQLGSSIYSLNFVRGKKAEMVQILDGFKNFVESFLAFVLVLLFTSLWALLFIIPGIVAALSYSQTFYILADKKIGAMEAIRESKRMMAGNKWKLFCLGLRFTGWFILSILTMGIGFLWLMPYMSITFANFYEDIKS